MASKPRSKSTNRKTKPKTAVVVPAAKSMNLADALEMAKRSCPPVFIEGIVISEGNRLSIVTSTNEYFYVEKENVRGLTPEKDGKRGVFVKSGCEVWHCQKADTSIFHSDKKFRVDEENIPAAHFSLREDDPIEGLLDGSQATLNSGKTLEGTCKLFTRSCNGEGSFDNNCAHFLSNAFINAGFSELNQSQNCVEIRCNHDNKCSLGSHLNHRIIRAKNMRCWFAEKAIKTSSSVSKNTGFWATYQERQDDGQGHVAILDSNKWRFYGTGWYSDWKQEYYQW